MAPPFTRSDMCGGYDENLSLDASSFSFYPFSLSSPMSFVMAIKKMRFVLLFYNISIMTLNVLIFNFDF
jgi:hypothetical protein